jgi:uncharacterized membrane protein
VVLAALGICIATYLTVTHASGHEPLCVGRSHACARVNDSRYAKLGPIRVAQLGVAGYVLLLVLALLHGPLVRTFSATAAVVAFGFSMWLTYLELARIHAVCQWCAGSAVVATLLALVHVWWLVVATGGVGAVPGAASRSDG